MQEDRFARVDQQTTEKERAAPKGRRKNLRHSRPRSENAILRAVMRYSEIVLSPPILNTQCSILNMPGATSTLPALIFSTLIKDCFFAPNEDHRANEDATSPADRGAGGGGLFCLTVANARDSEH